jgi:Secretion system C-terminal sorting domain
MSNKFFLFGLSFVFLLLISSFSPAQTDSLVVFVDNFESYTAGAQIACQDTIHINVNWNTWNSIPCDLTEDPYVTNTNSYSGSNSVWIQQDNDLVKPIPNYTYGKYSISFYMYIPADYTASWGQLAAFYNPDSTEWGFYVKFNPLGNGVLVAGGWGTAQFSFSYDTWMHNELIVDLNSDLAEYYFEGNLIHGWQWTLGNGGDTCKLQLSVTDLLGSNWPNPDSSQWYLDDYVLVRIDTIVGVKDFSEPTEFALEQNYPNPFNPVTSIQYAVSSRQFVSLKVYDVLGNEITTLVNEEKPIGSYEVEFNGNELTSGIYFYQLKACSPSTGSGQVYVETKKMMLLK